MTKSDHVYFCLNIGKRVHGLKWIVMWDKIEGAKYENQSYLRQ